MDLESATAKTLQATIAQASAIQAKNAIAGAKAHLMIVSADGMSVLVSGTALEESLGTDYTAICASAFTSINTALFTARINAQKELDALADNNTNA